MTRVTKAVEERRQEIVDTARILFVQKGYTSTAISDIASEMRVAQGLVYHYFDSKLEILYAVLDELIDEQIASVRTKVRGFKGSARDCLEMLLTQEHQPELLESLLPSIVTDRGIMEYAGKKMSVLSLPQFEDLIIKGNEDGSWNCPYPKETAIVILQGIGGLIDYEMLEESDLSEKQTIVGSIISRLLGIL
ncbi:MAG: TetR/AcrR family transcriptional regulator [Coriobacteriales bacterium]|jgi:AcrR family transcriptional regulator|nr:TetR/AcrR family transcriptional regulator [Coriobacteriales bacterium]